MRLTVIIGNPVDLRWLDIDLADDLGGTRRSLVFLLVTLPLIQLITPQNRATYLLLIADPERTVREPPSERCHVQWSSLHILFFLFN